MLAYVEITIYKRSTIWLVYKTEYFKRSGHTVQSYNSSKSSPILVWAHYYASLRKNAHHRSRSRRDAS